MRQSVFGALYLTILDERAIMSRAIQALKFGDETIYVEVSEVEQEGPKPKSDQFEYVNALDDIVEAGENVHGMIKALALSLIHIKALARTVQSALVDVQPSEWSIEINLGFKGKAGIPFITEGEANGAVKVVAKWVK